MFSLNVFAVVVGNVVGFVPKIAVMSLTSYNGAELGLVRRAELGLVQRAEPDDDRERVVLDELPIRPSFLPFDVVQNGRELGTCSRTAVG